MHCGSLTRTSTGLHLEQQRNAIGKAVDIDAGLQVSATSADRRLHHKGMPFQHLGVPCEL